MAPSSHRNPPFRAEHLGSLLRPKELLEARAAAAAGNAGLSAVNVDILQNASIKDVIDLQLKCGFHAITDGEYRRHMFWASFWPGLQGMFVEHAVSLDMFRTYVPDIAAFIETNENPDETVICVGKIKHSGTSCFIPELRYTQSLVPKEQWPHIKMTMPAPNWYHLRYKQGQAYSKEAYQNDDEYFADIAKAYQEEIAILYEAGLRNLQIDDPNLAYFCSEKMLQGWKEDPLNSRTSEETLDAYIKLYNDCISKKPKDMHIGLHLCRGNFVGSRHFSEGGYDRVAKKLFQGINVDTYYLEYDTERAGGFEPLKFLPAHKNVILGVVTSKFPKLEDKEAMKKRIYSAAEYVAQGSGQTPEEALQRLGVSPQCGFASHEGGNSLSYSDMEKKLALVRAIADDIWPGQP